MKVSLAVKKLNAELKALSSVRAQEKSQVGAVQKQETQTIDDFMKNPSIPELGLALGKLFALGQKEGALKDAFDPKIAADVKAGRGLLKDATAGLSLKQLNADRKELGLKALSHKPQPPKPANTNTEPWKPGPGQLEGSDTSHWQSDATFESSIAGKKFASIKATEGTGYVDPSFKKRWDELGKKVDSGKMDMRMAYCFLDSGNGKGQADHFLKTLGINGKLKPGTRLALDWEASALNSPQTLKDAAAEIHKVTGLWPTIYTSASQVSRARAAVPNAPMWDAQWTNGKSNHSVPFVQYSDGPGYDHDVFNGSESALRKFAGFSK
jgi:GH25 family lysozyme M1 (1,4-beta-N-acetylmuramidase)